MIVNCPSCQKDIDLPQPYLVHAAFTNRGFLYCERCPNTLTIEATDPELAKVVGAKHPWTLSYRERRQVESKLKPCPCQGRFGFDNPPRCPECRASWAMLVPDRLQFYETGRVIHAERDGWWANP
jgi:hypothetical protein